MFCKNCGAQIPDGTKFCPNCGASAGDAAPAQIPVINIVNNNTNTNTNTVHAPVRTVSLKNKWLAFWLCFFLGEFGVHRFYVGKIGTGILYLLTFGLFGIGWLVDTIMILCGKFRDSHGLILA